MATPLPPIPLRARVGRRFDADVYETVGRNARATILDALPPEFDFAGRRVLDFGCGAGRTLRHFTAEAERCEFLACDIDPDSVAWLRRHLQPPFRVFQNPEEPPLALDDGSLDLVIAVSVFTHLSESWSRWLAELHRVIAPGGFLFATVQGPANWPASAGARAGFPWDERLGFHVEQSWSNYATGHGPAVWTSPWWLLEHWGRAFELLSIEPEGFVPGPTYGGQGVVVGRRLDRRVTPEELEEMGDDPREAAAAAHSALLTRTESAEVVPQVQAQVHAARAETRAVREELARVRASRLMRWTEPARRAWYRLQRRRAS